MGDEGLFQLTGLADRLEAMRGQMVIPKEFWSETGTMLKALAIQCKESRMAWPLLVAESLEFISWCEERHTAPSEAGRLIGMEAALVLKTVIHHVLERKCVGDCLNCPLL